MSAEPPVAPKARVDRLDVARGALLVAMVIVHVVSGHATAAQSDSFHAWLGVFLISCGFVMVSGVVVGSQPGPLSGADATRAVDRFLQLLLVMFGFGVHPIGVILAAGLCGLGFYHRQSFPPAAASDDRRSYSLKPLAWILLIAALAFILLFLFKIAELCSQR